MEHAGDLAWNPAVVTWALTPVADAGAALTTRRDALSTREALDVVAQLAELDPGLVVIAGDELCERADLMQIVEEAVRVGLRLAIAPGPSPTATPAMVGALRDAGVRRLVVRLDARDASAPTALIAAARDVGLPLQIDTTLTRRMVAALPGLADAVAAIAPVRWNVTFAVTAAPSRRDVEIGPDAAERIFHFLYKWGEQSGIAVTTTAAPAYRRVVAQQETWRRKPRRHRPQPLDLNDGHGILFVSHTGDVYPSRELPLTTANVRDTRLATIYRKSRLFRMLRDPSRLTGKCAGCPFRVTCGGSRARAWAATGDVLATDPSCAWQPALAPAA